MLIVFKLTNVSEPIWGHPTVLLFETLQSHQLIYFFSRSAKLPLLSIRDNDNNSITRLIIYFIINTLKKTEALSLG